MSQAAAVAAMLTRARQQLAAARARPAAPAAAVHIKAEPGTEAEASLPPAHAAVPVKQEPEELTVSGRAARGVKRHRAAAAAPVMLAYEAATADVKREAAPSPSPSGSPSKKFQPLPPREPPPRWLETLEAIRAMRRQETAPVDVVGCAMLASTTDGEKVYRFQTLVALMLSSQTKDPVTAQAMANLRAHGLTVTNLLKTPPDVLDRLICKVGFHNRKTQCVLGIATAERTGAERLTACWEA